MKVIESMNFEEIGINLCQLLKHKDYDSIAEQFGYALAFNKPIKIAIKEDFENVLQESKFDLDNSKCNVIIKIFPKNELNIIRLIECRLKSYKSQGYILAEIIQNDSGLYLEQISSVT